MSLRRTAKQSRAYFRVSLSKMFESKLSLFLWTIIGLVSTFGVAYVWYAAGQGRGDINGLENAKILSYYLIRFVLWYFVGGVFAWIIDELIRHGTLSNYLVKPGNFLIYAVVWEQGWKFASLVLAIPAIIIFSIALGISPLYGITFESFLLSVPAVILGGVIFAEFQVLVGLSTLWLGSANGTDSLTNLVGNIFGGIIVPLALTPLWFQQICTVMPFKYEFAFPIEVMQQQVSDNPILIGYLVQIIWFFVLAFICRFVYRRGLVKYEGFGN